MKKIKNPLKCFIVHWQYHKYGKGYGASHEYIDSKELFEFENESELIAHLNYILAERKQKWDDIKSIKIVLKTKNVAGEIMSLPSKQ